MNIKNYTSEIPENQSVAKIERMLVDQGAKNVMKLYTNKELTGIAFIIDCNGQELPFKLPAETKEIFNVLWKLVKRPRSGTRSRMKNRPIERHGKSLQSGLKFN